MESWRQLNRVISITALALAIYAAIMLSINITSIYSDNLSYFEGEPLIYPFSVTLLMALSPATYAIIALLSYRNIKSYFIFPLFIYSAFVLFSYAAIFLGLLIVYWFFIAKPPNKSLKSDAVNGTT